MRVSTDQMRTFRRMARRRPRRRMPRMTSPVVTELPLALQPLTQDTFTHAAVRPVPAPQPPQQH